MKESHRHERAKKIMSGHKADMKLKKANGKTAGLSGAMPTTFPVSGESPRKRMDKKRRSDNKFASGGGIDGDMPKKKGSAKTEVNIVIAGKGDQGAPPAPMMPPPMAAPPPRPPMPPQGMPPRPPMGGGMPPGGMPPRPPGAMKRGGGVKEPKYPIDSGAGGAKGRLEKSAAEKSRRKKDG